MNPKRCTDCGGPIDGHRLSHVVKEECFEYLRELVRKHRRKIRRLTKEVREAKA